MQSIIMGQTKNDNSNLVITITFLLANDYIKQLSLWVDFIRKWFLFRFFSFLNPISVCHITSVDNHGSSSP